jgi:S-disulfanyl-L-cysteine oxidoreductase SoxD
MMRTARCAFLCVVAAVVAACARDAADRYPEQFALGRTPDAAKLTAIDIDVAPNGTGLPAGSGTATDGQAIYAASCASCHGANGEGNSAYPQLIGGPRGTFNFASDPKIPRTIGNYWPYATTLYDYIRRAMPLTAPGSLSAEQTYAVTAFLLEREGIVPPGTVLDAASLARIRMPARDHFVVDDRRGSTGGAKVR